MSQLVSYQLKYTLKINISSYSKYKNNKTSSTVEAIGKK